MSYTLDEVAEKTGRPQATLRKLIQRGQLHVEKEGNRTIVSEEALESFMAAEVLEDIADEVRNGRWDDAKALINYRLPGRIRLLFGPASSEAIRSFPLEKAAPVVDSTNVIPLGKGLKVEFRPAPKPSQKKKR